MMKGTLTFFILMFGVMYVVYASFDCRRKGQSCQNGGSCPDNSGDCKCPAGFEGYDCSVNSTFVNKGTCASANPCENSGTCLGYDDNSTSCACPPEYYGDTCSLSRYQVKCKSGSLLVGINPRGNFTGLIYVDSRRSCKFDIVGNVGDTMNRTLGWKGFAKDIGNTDTADNCTAIEPQYDPPLVENTTMASNTTTSYTRNVFVVYEQTFVTSLDEVLTFTCSFNADKVVIDQTTETEKLDVKDLNQKTTTATLKPVKFSLTTAKGTPGPQNKVTLGQNLTLTFTIDSESFDGARLESCVINDTRTDGSKLVIVENSCITPQAKSILNKPINKTDDDKTIKISLGIRVFKFVNSEKLGIVCKVKACAVGNGKSCEPRDCSNSLGNQNGYGRRKREAEDETMEVSRVLFVGTFVDDSEDSENEMNNLNPAGSEEKTCNVTKEVTAILAALGAVTLILLVVTTILLSRAIIAGRSSKSKGKDEPSETYSNLGQPRAFARKC